MMIEDIDAKELSSFLCIFLFKVFIRTSNSAHLKRIKENDLIWLKSSIQGFSSFLID